MKNYLPFKGNYPVTSEYGKRIINGVSDFHTGRDYGMAVGTELIPTEKVIFESKGFNNTNGTYIKLRTLRDPRQIHYLGHLSQVLCKEGQVIDENEVVALSGDSGSVTGAHLHWEVQMDGKAIDIRQYIDADRDASMGYPRELLDKLKKERPDIANGFKDDIRDWWLKYGQWELNEHMLYKGDLAYFRDLAQGKWSIEYWYLFVSQQGYSNPWK